MEMHVLKRWINLRATRDDDVDKGTNKQNSHKKCISLYYQQRRRLPSSATVQIEEQLVIILLYYLFKRTIGYIAIEFENTLLICIKWDIFFFFSVPCSIPYLLLLFVALS